MTILQALERYYHRLPGVAEPGWALVKFGWCIVLDRGGSPVDLEDLRDLLGKKPKPKDYLVPWSDKVAKRTSGIVTNLFVDKTAYVLGRTAGDGERTAQEHAAFVEMHLRVLTEQHDEGLVALRRFIENWQPEWLENLPRFTPEILDSFIMFRLDGDRCYLHERPASRLLLAAGDSDGDESPTGDEGFCLITGEFGPIARLHRSIKGVEDAQSSGAPLVSCNSKKSPAFSSYGKDQGLLAPTGKTAAFRYATALNHLLARDGPNRLRRPVGDATVVFWADASQAEAEAAENFFTQLLGSDVSDEQETAKVRKQMEAVAAGKPLAELQPGIEPGTRFHVLGLSPNAARLSVRFWLSDTLDAFAQRLARHHADLAMEPPPAGWGAAPSVNRLLANTTALQRDFKNIPPLLAGEVMRAVLSGTRYPLSLLSAALIRLRAGDNAASGWHAAVIRAVLVRLSRRNPLIPEQGEVPMSLKRDHANPGYQLGRLFAVYELAQRAALGKVNATIRDRYFGAASATPASVFPLIVRGGQNHLAKLRKEKPGWATLIERELEEINGRFDPRPEGIWPRSLRLQDQGEFAIGYYHQRAAKLSNDKGEAIDADDLPETTDHEGTEA
ncbi:type I-C CRISPR-associated protein Cas8c/Csd1 [Erythrobacter cryptus]|uniref:type I-C CRISPR-associated protein Cas8c/Csd1 n=1 Tax=Erythrobacter cryptus TaxID=196588 RepID=UPI0004878FC5|nr:type I-C CRISPR-associated protein Cas8c/Csd1 [Erythrobacter cryptus]